MLVLPGLKIYFMRGFQPINLLILALMYLLTISVNAQFSPIVSRDPAPGEIPVSKPGSYSLQGATYILVNDISSAKSGIFLGKDVTLDLNGHTLTYADGGYEHLPNYSFEEGLEGWDISSAPGATIEDTKVHVFVGDKILRLSAGEEIVSSYINLPVGERS